MILYSYKPELLVEGDPWYDFAIGLDLSEWEAHFAEKGIPFVTTRAKKGERRVLWIRYQYSQHLWIGGRGGSHVVVPDGLTKAVIALAEEVSDAA